MTNDLARWQFATTSIYHFFFVPLTISLSALTAGLQTAWVRTDKDKYLQATKFWGKLFLINIAMGVATGLVQEFQFGMNWSAYSRFVGDVFGAPLAFEALIAFFFESTFIGLWIFGWDKLPKHIHAACMWVVALGTVLSAYFILAANSWMQHPVGYRINGENGRADRPGHGGRGAEADEGVATHVRDRRIVFDNENTSVLEHWGLQPEVCLARPVSSTIPDCSVATVER